MLSEEQKAAGWIEHDGGPCPVKRTERVQILTRSGLAASIVAYDRDWKHVRPEDIIAYRPEVNEGDVG